jgi:hypothetical protein
MGWACERARDRLFREDGVNRNGTIGLPVGLLILAALAACGGQATDSPTEPTLPEESGMANPASVYCLGLGFNLEMRESEAGQYGVCIFPDGAECEEWDFLAGRCAPERSFCAQQGFTLQPDGNVGTCLFPDGTACPEIDFFEGRCGSVEAAPGPTPTASGLLGESDAPTSTSVVNVAGWLGAVYSLPAGGPADDYVSLAPEGTGEFGIAGSSPELEAGIVGLRDHPEPGKFANFWGTLACGAEDYCGCQLLVTRIRAGPVTSDPEPVDGWRGTIVSLDLAAGQFDDAFVLQGAVPVRFGIAPAVGSDGDLVNPEGLQALRGNGRVVTVWGSLLCGVPDVNGCQIQVERFEIGAP